MKFTASDVKALREKTGCGMMDCKKALTESDGNVQAAIDFLREKGLAAATKKSGRLAAEGLAVAYTNQQGNVGVAIEVNSETDFVGKNADFKSFVRICSDTVMEKNPSNVDELLSEKAVGTQKSINELLQEKILTIGENIKIRRFVRYEGIVSTYIHSEGRIGVMVKFNADKSIALNEEFKEFSKNIAMQIAACNPLYLNIECVPSDILDHEKKIISEQIANEGKSESIDSRMSKFYKDVCLLDQVYIKDTSMNIDDYIKRVSQKIGSEISIEQFVRFERGEGIEKA